MLFFHPAIFIEPAGFVKTFQKLILQCTKAQTDGKGNLLLSFDQKLSNIGAILVWDENGNELAEYPYYRHIRDAKDVIKSLACPGTLKSRVSIGTKARVTITDGTPLRIRTQPIKGNSTIITSLPEGTQMKIVEGPQCNDGWVWWKVKTDNGINGWVSEGDQNIWFIEPVN